jgi:hypothetical protein
MTPYRITSPIDKKYNCIAWAAGDTARFWWPTNPPVPRYYWPPSVPREETVAAFVLAFGTVGYEPCADGALEPGFEKIVIYAIGQKPKHAARVVSAVRWSSKMGSDRDIEHAPGALNGQLYGCPVQYMKRPKKAPSKKR